MPAELCSGRKKALQSSDMSPIPWVAFKIQDSEFGFNGLIVIINPTKFEMGGTQLLG